jgi:hypothetical protein
MGRVGMIDRRAVLGAVCTSLTFDQGRDSYLTSLTDRFAGIPETTGPVVTCD